MDQETIRNLTQRHWPLLRLVRSGQLTLGLPQRLRQAAEEEIARRKGQAVTPKQPETLPALVFPRALKPQRLSYFSDRRWQEVLRLWENGFSKKKQPYLKQGEAKRWKNNAKERISTTP